MSHGTNQAENGLQLQVLGAGERDLVGGEAGAAGKVQGECSHRLGQQKGVVRVEPLQKADRAHGGKLQLQSTAG